MILLDFDMKLPWGARKQINPIVACCTPKYLALEYGELIRAVCYAARTENWRRDRYVRLLLVVFAIGIADLAENARFKYLLTRTS